MKMSFESILSLFSLSHKEKQKQTNKTPIIYGLFFSAQWCPQSESITSEIKNFYQKVNSSKHQSEIFFLSSDIDKKSYDKYIKSMPWYSFAYNSSEISQLENELNIYAIPRLVILSNEGKILRNNGYKDIIDNGIESFDKWLIPSKPHEISEEIKNKKKTVMIGCHEHELKYCGNEDKSEIKSGWNCNECGRYYDEEIKSFYCFECNYDCCEKCFYQNIESDKM